MTRQVRYARRIPPSPLFQMGEKAAAGLPLLKKGLGGIWANDTAVVMVNKTWTVH